MANRNFKPGALALEQGTVKLYAKFTVGAANAITVNRGLGIASIARTAAGKVTITLEDTYPALLGITVVKSNASAAAEALVYSMVNEDVVSTKAIIVGFSNAAVPAFTDLTQGDVVYVELTLKNSGV